MKLKQWCMEKAMGSMGIVLPYVGDHKETNLEWWKEASRRAKELYQWSKK